MTQRSEGSPLSLAWLESKLKRHAACLFTFQNTFHAMKNRLKFIPVPSIGLMI